MEQIRSGDENITGLEFAFAKLRLPGRQRKGKRRSNRSSIRSVPSRRKRRHGNVEDAANRPDEKRERPYIRPGDFQAAKLGGVQQTLRNVGVNPGALSAFGSKAKSKNVVTTGNDEADALLKQAGFSL